MNDAAKPICILPIGDDGSFNGGCSSGKLIVIKKSIHKVSITATCRLEWHYQLSKKLWHLVKVILKYNDSFSR
jgi:hypothetical protein